MMTGRMANAQRRWWRKRRGPIRGALVGLLLVSTAATALAIGGRSSPVGAQAGVPTTASLVPETAVAYLAVNLDLESAQWRQARALLDRAGLGAVVDDLQASMLEDMVGDAAIDDLDPYLGGELAIVFSEALFASLDLDRGLTLPVPADIAASPEASPEVDPVAGRGVAAVLRPGDVDAVWTDVQEWLETTAEEAGAEVEEAQHNGVTIRFTESPKQFTDADIAIARLDEAVLFARQPADLEPIIDTDAGDIDPIADLDALADVRTELSDEFVLFGFFNGKQVADAYGEELAEFVGAISPTLRDQARLGYYAGVVVWADVPGFRFDSVAMPSEGATLPSVPENVETTYDARVPSDTLFFANGSDLGPSGALDPFGLSLAQALNQAFPDEEAGTPTAAIADVIDDMLSAEYVEEQFAAAEAVLGFDLRDDLLHQMVGEYAFAASVKSTLSPIGLSALLVWGVEESGTVEAALGEIEGLIRAEAGDEVDLTTREAEGASSTSSTPTSTASTS